MTHAEPTPTPVDAESAQSERRSRTLIKRGIQLRMAGLFAGLSFVCLLTQWLLFSSMLANSAHKMPVGGEYLLDLVPSLLYRALLFSLLIALPLTLVVGVQATFRITGPIYRFESYLKQVIRGTQLGPCKIRQGDALPELCELINQATEPVRRRTVEAKPAEAPSHKAA